MNTNQTPLCARYYSSQVKIQQRTRQRNHCFVITALIELPNWEERPFPARKAVVSSTCKHHSIRVNRFLDTQLLLLDDHLW